MAGLSPPRPVFVIPFSFEVIIILEGHLKEKIGKKERTEQERAEKKRISYMHIIPTPSYICKFIRICV